MWFIEIISLLVSELWILYVWLIDVDTSSLLFRLKFKVVIGLLCVLISFMCFVFLGFYSMMLLLILLFVNNLVDV